MRARAFLATLALTAISTSAHAADPPRVAWSPDWQPVRPIEIANVVALTVGSYAINAYWTPPTHAKWRGGILFDDWVRRELHARTPSLRQTAAGIGDQLYLGSVYVPLLVDVWTVALGIQQSIEVAGEMLLMNMQSLGLAGVGTLATERLVGRARPYTEDCRSSTTSPCGGGGADYQSFYSGHAAATATMAGLTCVHHQHLALYGGGAADLAPCLFMISVSLATGTLRVVADRHWASDTIVGWGVGAFAGYVLPSLLHYGFSDGHPVGALDVAGIHLAPGVEAVPSGAKLSVSGVLR